MLQQTSSLSRLADPEPRRQRITSDVPAMPLSSEMPQLCRGNVWHSNGAIQGPWLATCASLRNGASMAWIHWMMCPDCRCESMIVTQERPRSVRNQLGSGRGSGGWSGMLNKLLLVKLSPAGHLHMAPLLRGFVGDYSHKGLSDHISPYM